MPKPTALELWLQKGKPINIGPKEFLLFPLPLTEIGKVQGWIDGTTKDVLLEAMKEEKTPSPWGLIADVLKQVDVYELCLTVFGTRHPETDEPINKGLTREYLEKYLDTPTTQKIILTFIEINELEEAIKNLQRLPMVGSLMEALKSTFGLPFLTHLATSTDSLPGTSEGSVSPKSSNTSGDATGDTPANGPLEESRDLKTTPAKNLRIM